MNVGTAGLALFVALTMVFALATVYESGVRTTLTSTSTLMESSTLVQTRTLTVLSNSTLTRTTTMTASENSTTVAITKEVTTVLQEQVTQTGCGALFVTSYLTTSTTSYVIPTSGSQGVLTVESTTTTVTSPATTTVTNTTSIAGGSICA